VDYGAAEGDDLEDPAVWRRVHPGLAAGLTDEAFLRDQLRLGVDLFAREYLNVWPKGRAGGAIPADTWAAARVEAAPPARPGELWLAVDVAPGGASASIAAAWVLEGGRVHGAVVQSAPGTSWVEVALPDLWARLAPLGPVAYDPVSQAAGVLARTRVPSVPVPFAEVSGGVAWVLEALPAGRFTVTPDEDLDAAAASAVVRHVGDAQRPAWGRRASGAPITPLVAVTLAAWQAATPQHPGGLLV
jgi:hypothetical protein